jgi:two-component system chemotaxis sensor kinase CheA
MDKKQDAFLLELLKSFKMEATEHYRTILNELVELEKNPPAPELQSLIETIFREIHSIKGAAMAVNQHDIGRLCQGIESIFHKAKQGKFTLTSPHFEALYKAADLLGVMFSEIETTKKSIDSTLLLQIIKRLDAFTTGQELPDSTPIPDSHEITGASEKQEQPEPVSLSTLISDQKTIQTEPSPAEISGQIRIPKTDQIPTQDTVRIATSKLRKLLYEAEIFISIKAAFEFYIREIKKLQINELSVISKEMDQLQHALSRSVDDLLLNIKTTLLFPFSTVLDIIPKIVRDLGKEYKKEINLVILGGEIEIDRRILEEINNPLIHLIRNCIDHGLETPKIRKKAGKHPDGILEVIVRQDTGRQITVTVRDDGSGIDREKVIQSAIKAGIVSRESGDRMTDAEVFRLIFKSGISTSPFITDISGRGLGMAIVAEKVSKLGGSIDVDSVPGQGTTFTIKLPVTIANFRGVVVEVNDRFFIIPTTSVEKAVRIRKNEIRSVQSKQFILLSDESISLVRLSDILEIPVGKSKKLEEIPILILVAGQDRIAFGVDQVHGEMEVTVRDMGPQLVHVRNISGVTILGSGMVVPIINIPELMDSAAHFTKGETVTQVSEGEETPEKLQKRVLVAEDSITMRSLLRNILESAGFMVKTAVDGMEAYQLMQKEFFDLLVTDIEMPRMNGFELTTRIRHDNLLSAIPVILVTALDSPDDRQRGMESGANAYIVKGSFEQSNLMEMIHRLI